MLDLRRATMADSDLLLAWANDQETRAWSRQTAPISAENHERWMQLNVLQGYPAHIVMIADSDVGPVGVIRLDLRKDDVMTSTVSITVAPEHRGKKLGFAMLDLICKMVPDQTLLAEIRVNNRASRRIFEKCGFTEYARNIDYLRYRRDAQC
jgi:RimJ/RimL family protein N-acetyltransferase